MWVISFCVMNYVFIIVVKQVSYSNQLKCTLCIVVSGRDRNRVRTRQPISISTGHGFNVYYISECPVIWQ